MGALVLAAIASRLLTTLLYGFRPGYAPTVAVAPLVVIGVAVGVLAVLDSGDAPDRVAVLLSLATVPPLEEFRLLESPPDPALAPAASV